MSSSPFTFLNPASAVSNGKSRYRAVEAIIKSGSLMEVLCCKFFAISFIPGSKSVIKQLSSRSCISCLSVLVMFFLPNNSSSVITDTQHSFPSKCLPTCSFPLSKYISGLVSDTILIPLITFLFLVSECVLAPFYFAQVFFSMDYFSRFPTTKFFLHFFGGYSVFQCYNHKLSV
jgi:hypothetical protein